MSFLCSTEDCHMTTSLVYPVDCKTTNVGWWWAALNQMSSVLKYGCLIKISDWDRHTLELEWATHGICTSSSNLTLNALAAQIGPLKYTTYILHLPTSLYFNSSLNDPFYLSHYSNERNTQTPINSSRIPIDYIRLWEASAWHGGTTSVEDKMHVLKSMSACDHPQYQHSFFNLISTCI